MRPRWWTLEWWKSWPWTRQIWFVLNMDQYQLVRSSSTHTALFSLFLVAIAVLCISFFSHVFGPTNDAKDEIRLAGAILGMFMAAVSLFGVVTTYQVRRILRHQISNWERLLREAAEEIERADPTSDAILLICYSPNIGDISLRDDKAAHRAYDRFKQSLQKFISDSGRCEVICYSPNMLTKMLLGLQAYAIKVQDTGDAVHAIESGANTAVWQFDQVPPQHALILGTRLGYRFLVTDDVNKGVFDVHAIRSEDADEVKYMTRFWRKCSSDVASPVVGPMGFWIDYVPGRLPCMWAQFHDQSQAEEVHVQTSSNPHFDDSSYRGDDPAACWVFKWQKGGMFLAINATRASGGGNPQNYFRTRIAKKKRPAEATRSTTEWSRPFRPFLPTSRSEAVSTAIPPTLQSICAKAAIAAKDAKTAATQLELERNPLRYEFVYSYPPRATIEVSTSEKIARLLAESTTNRNHSPIALYVHFPFCRSKCSYCHYCAAPVNVPPLQSSYVNALMKEIERAAERRNLQGHSVESVYLGGGTPSLMADVVGLDQGKNALELILEKVKSVFRLVEKCEITCECAPIVDGRIAFEKLYDAGVNRLSIGVQSFDKDTLDLLGRGYTPADAMRAIEDCGACRFRQVNVDLLYGLPGPDAAKRLDRWLRTLQALCRAMPEGVTLYQLRVKKSTAMADATQYPDAQFPQDLETLTMAAVARLILTNVGYTEVAPDFYVLQEVADSGKRRKGTLSSSFYRYQGHKAANGQFLGVGASAYSFLDGWLTYNVNTTQGYLDAIGGPTLPISHCNMLTPAAKWRRHAIVGLRYGAGIAMDEFKSEHGDGAWGELELVVAPLRRAAMMIEETHKTDGPDALRLTAKGRLFVDEICTLFYENAVATELRTQRRQYGAYAAVGRGEGV